VRFCIDSFSLPSLIILRAFLLTGSAYLDRQSLIPVADRPCVSLFLLTESAYLDRQILIPVADRPLRVSAHRECVSGLTESYSRR